MMRDMITRTRCYRRSKQNIPIAEDTLKELVDIARISASASNRQPLRYMLSCDPKQNENIFLHLSWTGYLKDWDGPHKGQRPTAYILVLGDRTVPLHNMTPVSQSRIYGLLRWKKVSEAV